jgi:predicted nuclease of predicted toxin-antitoxin system
LMVLVLCTSGCVSTHVIDTSCLWVRPITITKKELKNMSIATLRQIDDLNQEYEFHCVQND